MLSEHTIINYLDTKVPTYYNMDTVIQDLRELRRIFKKYLNKKIIIPRDQWNITRCKLVSTRLNTRYFINFIYCIKNLTQ